MYTASQEHNTNSQNQKLSSNHNLLPQSKPFPQMKNRKKSLYYGNRTY
jgi:hypothetical protein